MSATPFKYSISYIYGQHWVINGRFIIIKESLQRRRSVNLILCYVPKLDKQLFHFVFLFLLCQTSRWQHGTWCYSQGKAVLLILILSFYSVEIQYLLLCNNLMCALSCSKSTGLVQGSVVFCHNGVMSDSKRLLENNTFLYRQFFLCVNCYFFAFYNVVTHI